MRDKVDTLGPILTRMKGAKDLDGHLHILKISLQWETKNQNTGIREQFYEQLIESNIFSCSFP